MEYVGIALTDTLTAIIVVISAIFILSYIIGSVFKVPYFLFLDITIIVLILSCYLYKNNNELKANEYYKYHIGYISCDEYYRRHLYHTGWHIYGESMEQVKIDYENADYEIFDGLRTKEISP